MINLNYDAFKFFAHTFLNFCLQHLIAHFQTLEDRKVKFFENLRVIYYWRD